MFFCTSNYPEKRKERKREGGSGWGTHVNPWLIHVNVWQKPLQYCKVISLQLIKINEKERKKESPSERGDFPICFRVFIPLLSLVVYSYILPPFPEMV